MGVTLASPISAIFYNKGRPSEVQRSPGVGVLMNYFLDIPNRANLESSSTYPNGSLHPEARRFCRKRDWQKADRWRCSRWAIFGGLEIALIVLAIVLIFGIGKLGQVGGALGKSIREFRRERDKKDDVGSGLGRRQEREGCSQIHEGEVLPRLRQQDSSERQVLHGMRGQDGGLQLEAS